MSVQFFALFADNDLASEVDKALELLSSDRDKCVEFTTDLLEKGINTSDNYIIVKSNFILGYVFEKKKDYGKAVIFYLEGIRYAEEADQKALARDIIYLFQNTGNIFKKFGNYELAREYYSKAMAIASEEEDFQKYTYLVLLSAKVLKEEGRYDEAIDLLKTTFSSFQHIKKKTVADIYNQLGLINTEANYREQALINFEKLLKYVENEPELKTKYTSWGMHNIGNLYYKLENYEKAIGYFRNSIESKESTNTSKHSLFISYKDLGDCYLRTKQYKSAGEYFDKASLLLADSKNIPKYYELHKFQAAVSIALGDLDGYVKYQSLYSDLLEHHHEEQRQIEAADKKYNLDLITQRYFALVAEQERTQQIQYYSAVGGSFLVTLIVLIIAFFQYRKYRLRKDLEASLKPYIKNAL